MVVRLDISQDDFADQFDALLNIKRELSQDVMRTVRDILDDVTSRGDAAVIDYTCKFDRLDLTFDKLAITSAEVDNAVSKVDKKTYAALELARDRISSYHQRQLPQDDYYTDEIGVELGTRWTAIESVGLYVPGGTASYPSSVLMNAVPANVAGVERIVMVVPTPDGVLNPLVLAAAHLSGVTEIYRIGGAQAIAALAFGTDTIRPVDKIVGPGNAYVAEAKRQVFGTVGIDMIAGPSEVLVVADPQNNPDWIAVDLMAQAEHDVSAQSILITDDVKFANRVEQSITNLLKTLPRAEIAGQSWQDFGAVIIVDNLQQAPELIDRIAPEHLELAVETPDVLFEKIRNAGAVFLGRYTPEAVGDYVGGTNHVLPTARSARFSSGLSVLEYLKRTSILKCGPEQLRQIGPAAITLAEAEGLGAHGRSIATRLNL